MNNGSQSSPHTVSSLTQDVKEVLERKYSKIYIEGEISGFKVYPSGHAYFTLKDELAQISAVMFKSSFERCKVRSLLKDGAKILVYATVTFYPVRGSCQLTVLAAKLVGEGDLMQRFIELKTRLGQEGLFEASRKKPLPYLPRRIGLITSLAGAVVHDFCRVIAHRMPNTQVRIFPTLVQGDEAPATLIAGLEYFNSPNDGFLSDVIVIARGGGSFEDLFCFNDEALVRSIAKSKIPVISAVGHETDYTLCDFVADFRAGTPSIAAERVVPEKVQIKSRLDTLLTTLTTKLSSKYESRSQYVDYVSEKLSNALWHSQERFSNKILSLSNSLSLLSAQMQSKCLSYNQKIDSLATASATTLKFALAKQTARLDTLSSKLSVLSPYSVLERGYSLTTTQEGVVVKSSSQLMPGQIVKTRLSEGAFVSVVSEADK